VFGQIAFGGYERGRGNDYVIAEGLSGECFTLNSGTRGEENHVRREDQSQAD
jgi:hypothetical protein